MGATFLERLEERIAAGAAPACVGIDPRPDRLPATVAPDAAPADRVVAFAREVLPRIARHAPVVKPNVAFFEALGWEGYRAYEAVCRAATDAGTEGTARRARRNGGQSRPRPHPYEPPRSRH